MASNIKIVGNILSTTTVSRYSDEDIKLISSRNLPENFGGKNDYIEYHIYDIKGNSLNINYNYLNYKLPPNSGLTPGAPPFTNTTGEIQTENVGIESTLSSQTSSLYPIIEIDPIKDLEIIMLELALKDLETCKNRIEKIPNLIKKSNDSDKKNLNEEFEFLKELINLIDNFEIEKA